MWRLLHADLKHSYAYMNWTLGLVVGFVMLFTSPRMASRFGPNIALMVTTMSIVFFRMRFTRSQWYPVLDSAHLPLSCTRFGVVRICYACIYWLIHLAGALAFVTGYAPGFWASEWAFLPKLGCIALCTHALLLISLDLQYILQNNLGKGVNYLGTTLTLLAAMVSAFIVMLPPVEAEPSIPWGIRTLHELLLGSSGLVGLLACGLALSLLSLYTYSKRKSYLR